MVITGRYDHVIDDKGRLAIPSQVRNAMDAEQDGAAFYLVPEGRYLQLIPEKLFDRLAQVPAGLMPAPEIAKIRRFLFSTTTRLDPDKQGRVVIPDGYMMDSPNPDPLITARLKREVTLVGASDRLELWNRDEYLAHMREAAADRASFQVTLQKLFGDVPPAPGAMNPGQKAQDN
jgi:MraZ protein